MYWPTGLLRNPPVTRCDWGIPLVHWSQKETISTRSLVIDTMRILLADDAAKVRFALRALLERRRGFKVVGEAIDSPELLALSKAINPDLILLDWELPGFGPTLTMLALRVHCPQTKVIALSSNPEAEKDAVEAGVDAFIGKTAPPGYVLKVLYEIWNDTIPIAIPLAKEA